MGYRSEVALKAQFTSTTDRDRVIAMLPERQRELVAEMLTIPEDRPVLYAHYPWIKWYSSEAIPGYEGVDAVEALISLCGLAADGMLEDIEEVIPNVGFFARIGEDADDAEERYWHPSYAYQQEHPEYDLPEPWDMGSIQRSIVLDED